MANRNFKPGAMTIEKGTIKLYGRVVIGTTGAIASQVSRGFLVALTTSPGIYTITLEDKYTDLYGLVVNVTDAVAAGEGKFAQITAEDVSGAKTIEFTMVASDDGLAANVASGGILSLEITLKNSSVAY